ncbi:hypothetical protein [Enemella sp. A6]|uniref:hypothetical protein n=1 Tax=Enemella sp. A6 TaxID=3440152 RepID=UPI003EBF361E
MTDSTAPNTVQLSPTRGQYVHAFMWVVIGLLIGAFFLWLALRGDQMGVGGLIIGGAVFLIAITSAVLEYRNLPGVTLEFDANRLTVRPHTGDPSEVPLAELGYLETLHLAPLKRRARRRDAMLPADTARPSFGSGQAGWHLNVVRADGEPVGPVSGYRIGLDEQRTEDLREACRRAGVRLKLGS